MDLKHGVQKFEDSLQKISENQNEASGSYPHTCYTGFSLAWEEIALLVLTDHGGAPC